MAKSRPEEADRRAAKDVVENGERPLAPGAFGFLMTWLSSWLLLTNLFTGHLLRSVLSPAKLNF